MCYDGRKRPDVDISFGVITTGFPHPRSRGNEANMIDAQNAAFLAALQIATRGQASARPQPRDILPALTVLNAIYWSERLPANDPAPALLEPTDPAPHASAGEDA